MANTKAEVQVAVKINGEIAGKTIGELEKNVKQLNRELNKLPIGTQEWVEKLDETKKAEARFGEAKTAAKGYNAEVGKSKDALLNLIPGFDKLSGAKETFGNIKTAAGAGAGGINLVRMALIALPIMLIVAAISALVGWILKTDNGAKMLEGTTRALSAGFDTLMNRLLNIGDTLRDLFTNPVKFFKDLANDVKEGVKTGYELANVYDELDEKQRDIDVANSKEKVRLSQLLIAIKNTKISEAERLKLAEEAGEIEERIHNRKMAQQEAMIAAIRKENALKEKAGSLTDEDARKLADAEIAKQELLEESTELQERLANRTDALKEALLKKEQERAEKRRKAEADAQKKAADERQRLEKILDDREKILADLRVASIKNEDDRKRAQLELNFKRQIEDLQRRGVLTEEIARTMELQKFEALAEIERQEDKRKEDKRKDDAAKQAQLQVEADELAKGELQLKFEKLLITETEYQDQLFLIQQGAIQRRLAALTDLGLAEGNEAKRLQNELLVNETKYHKARVEQVKQATAAKNKLEMAAFKDASSIVAGTIQLLEQDENARKQNFVAIKALKGAAITLNLVEELSGIWQNANTNPINALIPGWGPVFAGVQTAFALARYQVGMNQLQTAQYAKGGLINPVAGVANVGARHGAGGIKMFAPDGSYVGEWERGEPYMILSRNTYANNRPVVDALLDTSLNRNGAPIRMPRFADGGIVGSMTGTANSQLQSQMSQEQLAMIGQQLALLNTKFDAWPREQKAYIVYEQMLQMTDESDAIRTEAQA